MGKYTQDLRKYSTFKLRDFDKVNEKYGTYAPRSTVSDDDSQIYSVLDYGMDFYSIYNEYAFRLLFQSDTPAPTHKAKLKQLHTLINNWTWSYHQKQYQSLGFTASQSVKLASRFYVRNYDKINSAMSEFFLEAVAQATIFNEQLRKEAQEF